MAYYPEPHNGALLEGLAAALAFVVIVAAICFRQIEVALGALVRVPAERRRKKRKAIEAQQAAARRRDGQR